MFPYNKLIEHLLKDPEIGEKVGALAGGFFNNQMDYGKWAHKGGNHLNGLLNDVPEETIAARNAELDNMYKNNPYLSKNMNDYREYVTNKHPATAFAGAMATNMALGWNSLKGIKLPQVSNSNGYISTNKILNTVKGSPGQSKLDFLPYIVGGAAVGEGVETFAADKTEPQQPQQPPQQPQQPPQQPQPPMFNINSQNSLEQAFAQAANKPNIQNETDMSILFTDMQEF